MLFKGTILFSVNFDNNGTFSNYKLLIIIFLMRKTWARSHFEELLSERRFPVGKMPNIASRNKDTQIIFFLAVVLDVTQK